MAVQTQVWLKFLVENFFPANSFVAKSQDDAEHVNHKTVHIPNAGSPSKVKKNRSVFPAGIGTREDKDVTYNIEKFSTDPVRVHNISEVELSYDKLASIIANDKAELQRVVHEDILDKWGEAHGAIVRTSGKALPAHTHEGATGTRKGVTAQDILDIATVFDNQLIPEGDRYLLLDATMYNRFLGSLVDSDLRAFQQLANAEKGVMGELYGIKILKRSRVLRLKSDAETLLLGDEAHEATELAAGIAWHTSCVSRAIGAVNMYHTPNSPEYYGDIVSFDMRAGGAGRRHDKKGIILLVETAG